MTLSEDIAIELLRTHSTSEKDFDEILEHSKVVQKLALDLASEIADADLEFIKVAAILHDIGRFDFPSGEEGLKHGVYGAQILRKYGYEAFARVCERHIGVGITREEIIERKLPLPARDFIPETVDEKIIAYADSLVYGTKLLTLDEALERFKKIGDDPAKRFIELHNEILKLRGK